MSTDFTAVFTASLHLPIIQPNDHEFQILVDQGGNKFANQRTHCRDSF